MCRSLKSIILILCFSLSLCSCADSELQNELDELTLEYKHLEDEYAFVQGYNEDLLDIISGFSTTLKFSDFFKQKNIKSITFNEKWELKDLFQFTPKEYNRKEAILYYELICNYDSTLTIPNLTSFLLLVQTSQGEIYYLDNFLLSGANCLYLADYKDQEISVYLIANTNSKQYLAKLNLK